MMVWQKYRGLKKAARLAFLLAASGMLAACGQGQEMGESAGLDGSNGSRKEEPLILDMDPTGPDAAKTDIPAADAAKTDAAGADASGSDGRETPKADSIREMFGEGCIAGQTFEVELSEYEGKVWFVPFSPSGEQADPVMQIIQDGSILTEIRPYMPERLAGETFTSLDAVSFYDINYDGNTDILLIETYGSTSFAAVYYGFPTGGGGSERYFVSQEQLSEHISEQAAALSVPEIRRLLSDGKRNGEFTSYQEAYEAVIRLCELESTTENGYGLIDFDGNDIPELASGVNGYYVSLYTYDNGTVYTLMDHWVYGAGGNAGYEYAPGKNSLVNFNHDYAGAICYTTYMTASARHTMETVVQIETYNFDDANGNGIPDDNELDSVGYYSVSYINGTEASPEECAAYDAGGYEYMETPMTAGELRAQLNKR